MEKLEAALAEATQLAKRYRRLYLDEKSARRAARAPSPEPDSDRSRDTDSSRLTEEDLEDDEALFKRHVARLADTKSMLATTPIRVQDVIRKNEVCPLKSVMMPTLSLLVAPEVVVIRTLGADSGPVMARYDMLRRI